MTEDAGSIKDDLWKTVNELSEVYEELSLLYRFSSSISGMDVDEICSKVVEQAVSSTESDTAAVMLLDEELQELYTFRTSGKWDNSVVIEKDDSAIWQSLTRNKPIAICDIKNHAFSALLPDINTVLLCPMIGKKKIIGLLAVADKTDGKEFYSRDIKLVNAIAQQAALFMENAMLNREMEDFLVGTIRSFVKALEASSMWTAGHTERVTGYALAIGKELGLDTETIDKLRICSLLHDIGKIATPKDILNKKGALSGGEWIEIRRHPSVGAGILDGLEKFGDITDCIKYHHEHFNGQKGIYGLDGEKIPLLSRIMAVADAFDAMTSDRPYRKKKSVEDAVAEIERCSGTQFDPKIVDAFKGWVNRKVN
ncbi:cyclic di-GMP phosphodiesterase response regulator RpfG [bacterium BMS3Abin07]|nr:cyclic di-GMP phosphodiesterase response regulator RpfG [bacterium BMS3Abin07]GBE32969.1 cyclic di-GMP phosphodiesterase response regulator RpfG [bacterium BMS3Bbin05]HDL21016.1 HD domain-containing protein [Nitrospirota bacterium]HDO22989.1 HD domain-containing protein [Nitrospirota bacterium]HDZ88528.1 HD domain-containing protein [Nitrospirota bacterium]